jgi:hypothetical protein
MYSAEHTYVGSLVKEGYNEFVNSRIINTVFEFVMKLAHTCLCYLVAGFILYQKGTFVEQGFTAFMGWAMQMVMDVALRKLITMIIDRISESKALASLIHGCLSFISTMFSGVRKILEQLQIWNFLSWIVECLGNNERWANVMILITTLVVCSTFCWASGIPFFWTFTAMFKIWQKVGGVPWEFFYNMFTIKGDSNPILRHTAEEMAKDHLSKADMAIRAETVVKASYAMLRNGSIFDNGGFGIFRFAAFCKTTRFLTNSFLTMIGVQGNSRFGQLISAAIDALVSTVDFFDIVMGTWADLCLDPGESVLGYTAGNGRCGRQLKVWLELGTSTREILPWMSQGLSVDDQQKRSDIALVEEQIQREKDAKIKADYQSKIDELQKEDSAYARGQLLKKIGFDQKLVTNDYLYRDDNAETQVNKLFQGALDDPKNTDFINAVTDYNATNPKTEMNIYQKIAFLKGHALFKGEIAAATKTPDHLYIDLLRTIGWLKQSGKIKGEEAYSGVSSAGSATYNVFEYLTNYFKGLVYSEAPTYQSSVEKAFDIAKSEADAADEAFKLAETSDTQAQNNLKDAELAESKADGDIKKQEKIIVKAEKDKNAAKDQATKDAQDVIIKQAEAVKASAKERHTNAKAEKERLQIIAEATKKVKEEAAKRQAKANLDKAEAQKAKERATKSEADRKAEDATAAAIAAIKTATEEFQNKLNAALKSERDAKAKLVKAEKDAASTKTQTDQEKAASDENIRLLKEAFVKAGAATDAATIAYHTAATAAKDAQKAAEALTNAKTPEEVKKAQEEVAAAAAKIEQLVAEAKAAETKEQAEADKRWTRKDVKRGQQYIYNYEVDKDEVDVLGNVDVLVTKPQTIVKTPPVKEPFIPPTPSDITKQLMSIMEESKGQQGTSRIITGLDSFESIPIHEETIPNSQQIIRRPILKEEDLKKFSQDQLSQLLLLILAINKENLEAVKNLPERLSKVQDNHQSDMDLVYDLLIAKRSK